jgi:hypothetical protein
LTNNLNAWWALGSWRESTPILQVFFVGKTARNTVGRRDFELKRSGPTLFASKAPA